MKKLGSFLSLIIIFSTVFALISCGNDNPQSSDKNSDAILKKFTTVTENSFTWPDGRRLQINNTNLGRVYNANRGVTDHPAVIEARFFIIEDLADFTGELRCDSDDCVIVSKTPPAEFKGKLRGNFRYEHITDTATTPSSAIAALEGMKLGKGFGDASKNDQATLKQEFDKLYQPLKTRFDDLLESEKYSFKTLDGEHYEGEVTGISQKRAHGIGKLTSTNGDFLISIFVNATINRLEPYIYFNSADGSECVSLNKSPEDETCRSSTGVYFTRKKQ